MFDFLLDVLAGIFDLVAIVREQFADCCLAVFGISRKD